jgi:hypothetical protein
VGLGQVALPGVEEFGACCTRRMATRGRVGVRCLLVLDAPNAGVPCDRLIAPLTLVAWERSRALGGVSAFESSSAAAAHGGVGLSSLCWLRAAWGALEGGLVPARCMGARVALRFLFSSRNGTLRLMDDVYSSSSIALYSNCLDKALGCRWAVGDTRFVCRLLCGS